MEFQLHLGELRMDQARRNKERWGTAKYVYKTIRRQTTRLSSAWTARVKRLAKGEGLKIWQEDQEA